MKHLISYISWTKDELQAIVKDFLKVIPHRFAEGFNISIQIYLPGFSDFYQLVHIVADGRTGPALDENH